MIPHPILGVRDSFDIIYSIENKHTDKPAWNVSKRWTNSTIRTNETPCKA
jgi:hypothetical protein